MLRIITILTCALSLVAPAYAGVAEDVAATNRLAMENYDLEDYASARDALLGSAAKLERAGLAASPVAAQTHMLLGVVYGLGLQDEAKAVEHFAKAITIDDAIVVDARYASDATAALLERGRASLAPPPPEKADCATLQGIAHTIVDTADAGTEVTIACQVGGGLTDATIVLAYRADGAAAFEEIPMTAGEGCDYAATIPADAVVGSAVSYYIAAKSKAGKLLASKGRDTAPFLLGVNAPVIPTDATGGGAGAESSGAGGEAVEEEVPDEIRGPKPPPGRTGCAGCTASGGSNSGAALLLLMACAAAFDRRKRRRSRRRDSTRL